MAGFLGTKASFTADLAVVLTWIFGAAAVLGAVNGRRRRFNRHCPVMAVSGLLNWIPVLMIMIPRWLGVVVGGQPLPGSGSVLSAVGHGVLGGTAQLLITYTAVRMYRLEELPPRKPIWLMRITFVFWLLSILGGTFLYALLYVI